MSLHQSGFVDNTLGEFSSVGVFTFDVAREEVNMHGSKMIIQLAACHADVNVCAFKCKNGTSSCGKEHTYTVDDDTCPGADIWSQGVHGIQDHRHESIRYLLNSP